MSQKAAEIAEAEMEVRERRLEARKLWMDWQEALQKVEEAQHRLAAVREEPFPGPTREG